MKQPTGDWLADPVPRALAPTSPRPTPVRRRLAVGAELLPGGGAHFRVWAPSRRQVAVVLEDGDGRTSCAALAPEADGYFAGLVPDVADRALYWLRLDGDETVYPDPASRFQPRGPHGPSCVIDPSRFPWTDADWRGVPADQLIVYEMHVGTFTGDGTWSAASRRLGELADLGITCIEMMPVAEFAGRFGWGYDGVDLFAPTQLYGDPDDLRRFVDEAHGYGMAVILDVVYNHFGPAGNYLNPFSDDYVTDRHETEWGDAINFDGPGSGPVRELILANARYWVEEFHFDGLRIDATQNIVDSSPDHILAAIVREVRAAGRGRRTFVVGENEPQQTHYQRPPERGGFGFDALWNDDFHHAAVVALTGKSEGYYSDYRGAPQELVSAVKYGYLYQGQRYKWQRARRGTPTFDLPPQAFVAFIENHDQVANSAAGRRLHQLAHPGCYRAMTALLLLAPSTPMLFQGQEFAATSPFLYFADHEGELGEQVRQGRAQFLTQFASIATPEMITRLADPTDPATFQRCKLDFTERLRHESIYVMHRDLIRLRRTDPVWSRPRHRGVDGAVLGPHAFVLRFFGEDDQRLLLVNLGADLRLNPAPEPLLAPPPGSRWHPVWSSDDPRYGGAGTPPLETRDNWRIPGHAAVALQPGPPADDLARGGNGETEEAETRREALSRVGRVMRRASKASGVKRSGG